MKKIHYLQTIFIALILFSIASCSDKDSSSGISNQTWSANETLVIPEGSRLTVSFTAEGKWTAISGAEWCKISPSSGGSGKNTLSIFATSSTLVARTTSIIVNVNGTKTSTTFNVRQNIGSGGSEDLAINAVVDAYLKTNYLWNEEYKTLAPDFNLSYDQFLSRTLMSMSTNTLDKKLYKDMDNKFYYSLFSYIFKKNKLASARSTKEVGKEKEYNFGITGVMPVKMSSDGSIFFEIQGVYQNSSAEAQGLKRGSRIYYINNQKITENDYQDKGNMLVSPSSHLSLQVADIDKKAVTINSAPVYVNPIILNKVINRGTNRIGYLVYAGFDAGFDEELFDVFKKFKDQRVTDLILDLRYNRGGHVISADLISSCIAGESCKDKIFIQYRYNAERMKKYNGYDARQFSYDSYDNLDKISLAAGGLNLNRLYCIISKHSASASELVINSLKGIGLPVILIGQTTYGKNVGMEPININDNGNTYELAPITFQSYNAQGYGDYEKGFKPDYEIDEDGIDGDAYFGNYIDYGADEEPLFSKAISLITGEAPRRLKAQSTTRNAAVRLPLPLSNPKHAGMIKLSDSK